MKQFLWLSILFFSISWLFFIPLFSPSDNLMGFIFIMMGIICTIYGTKDVEFFKIDRKYLFILFPILISLLFIEFPFSLGPLILAIGMIFLVMINYWMKYKTCNQIIPGIFISGLILIVQAALFPIYVIFASRYHEAPLAFPLSIIGNMIGLHTSSDASTLFVGELNNNLPILVTWNALGFFIFLNFFIGALTLFLFISKKEKIAINILKLLVIGILYSIVRFVFLITIDIELMENSIVPTVFYDPLWLFISFIPFTFLLMRFISLKEVTIRFDYLRHFKINKRQIIASVMMFIFIFSAVGTYAFQDPGNKKKGKILIDELHSDWESSLRALDKEWYGDRSTYNYYSLAEWMNHYYTVDKNTDALLTIDLLKNYDILVLKCPTNPYSKEEISSIIQFVDEGGGLYLIGDHTNVFGMNSYLNQIAKFFDIEFNFDSTYSTYLLGGFSTYIPSKMLPHPIVRTVSEFQFLTSCTIDAPLTAEEVIIGNSILAKPGTYATEGFFPESKFSFEGDTGLFLQCVAAKYGKGRIVAFSDSTVFSSFSIFMDGYTSFNLGAIDYLNRENVYDVVNTILLIIAIAAGIIVIFLLQKEKKIMIILLVISVGLLSYSTAIFSISSLNRNSYPLPEPEVPFEKRVCFLTGYSGGIISAVPAALLVDEKQMNMTLKKSYDTFFVWTQRVGCNPFLENDLENAFDNSDLVVLINLITPFSSNEIDSILEYINKGGKLLVMDSITNIDSTTNDLLSYFDMKIITQDQEKNTNSVTNNYYELFQSDKNISVFSSPQPYLSIIGGQDIFTTITGQTIISTKNWGKGMVGVSVDSLWFSDFYMGGVLVTPTITQLDIYDLEYYLIDDVLLPEEHVNPAEIKGYIYLDNNLNDQYDLLDDQLLHNANISVWKMDNFNASSEQLQKHVIFKETSVDENGYYKISNLPPGYYLVNVSSDEFLIHQNIVYLPSGSLSYNISKQNYSGVTGVIYHDVNANEGYDIGEEQVDVYVELYYNTTGQELLLIDTLITNQTGRFSFNSLIPGFYLIKATKYNSTTESLTYWANAEITVREKETAISNISLISVHTNQD